LTKSGNLSRFLDGLSLADLMRAVNDWPVFAGLKQRPPLTAWRTWLMLGGRGAGKTRAGAQWLSGLIARDGHFAGDAAGRVAIIGETYSDARAVMVEGESGLLAVSAPGRRPQWNSAKRELVWPDGTIGQVFSAADPEGLRGSQFGAAWCDVIAVAAAFTGMIGITLDQGDQTQIADAMVQIIAAAGALLAIHGRLTATEVIA
jgi:phage terminase large subunit-like protein